MTDQTEMQARIDALEEHIANMLEMQECACGYDSPTDICLGHATVLKRIEALEAERDRLRETLARVNLAVATSDDAPEGLLAWVEIQTRAALKGEGE